jgi:hypothetical protein
MPVPVKTGMVPIIAFLDLERNISFLDGHCYVTGFVKLNNSVSKSFSFFVFAFVLK